MEFLEGETEARYAWAAAAKVARQESLYALRMAALARLMQESWRSVLRDHRTVREGLVATQPAAVMGRFAQYPPDYFPHSALALRDALAAGWKPAPSMHSAYAVHMEQKANH